MEVDHVAPVVEQPQQRHVAPLRGGRQRRHDPEALRRQLVPVEDVDHGHAAGPEHRGHLAERPGHVRVGGRQGQGIAQADHGVEAARPPGGGQIGEGSHLEGHRRAHLPGAGLGCRDHVRRQVGAGGGQPPAGEFEGVPPRPAGAVEDRPSAAGLEQLLEEGALPPQPGLPREHLVVQRGEIIEYGHVWPLLSRHRGSKTGYHHFAGTRTSRLPDACPNGSNK